MAHQKGQALAPIPAPEPETASASLQVGKTASPCATVVEFSDPPVEAGVVYVLAKRGHKIYTVDLNRLTCTCSQFSSTKRGMARNQVQKYCTHLFQQARRMGFCRRLTPNHELIEEYFDQLENLPFVIGDQFFLSTIDRNDILVVQTADTSWVDVLTRKKRAKDSTICTGEMERYGYNAPTNRWAYGEAPFHPMQIDKVLQHLMSNGVKVAGGDRLGKTIIFAKSSKHAQFIVDRFNLNYPHYEGKFAQLIDYSVSYAQSLIDDFSEIEKTPHIAVSVDMMDTGIDVPEVVNLVFFKIVRSKTKFWQMVGRGTCLCPDLFGPSEDKEEFLIFDFCQNLEFFRENPAAIDAPVARPIGERLFVTRVVCDSIESTLVMSAEISALWKARSACSRPRSSTSWGRGNPSGRSNGKP